MQKYALGELNVACPQNNKCQRCGYLPQQTQTDRQTHTAARKDQEREVELSSHSELEIVVFYSGSNTWSLGHCLCDSVPHSHWKSKLLHTGWSHLFNISFFPLYKQKLLSGSSQMTFTLSLMLDSTVRDNMWAFLVMWWDRVTVKQWWRVKAFTLKCQIIRAQELCESQGGCPGLPSLINLWFLWT